MALNVGINGFGRIGRIIFRTCLQNPNLKVSAINDPAVDIDYICYLIKFDSTHGKFRGTVERCDKEIIINGHKIAIFREKVPTNIPWQVADVQYVVEASGTFTNLEKASGHLASEGVKRVIVTAPSLDVPMVVLGVNNDTLKPGHKVLSCTSSTLYCLAPIIKILDDNFGVSEGFITSIHAMTPSLKPLDGLCLKGKHWRDHRSIHQNIIPAATGACRALGKIIPQVKDKMTGLAFRVPIVNVSVLDITVRLKSNTTLEDIKKHVENAGKTEMKNIIKLSNEQAVSSDFIGDTFSCILDVDSSLQLSPDFFKLICWYENEYSYACRVTDSIFFLEKQYQMEWKSKIAYIRPTPKQSIIQQTECPKNAVYHQACSFDCNSNLRSSCSTSQDSGFKSLKRTPCTRKPIPCRNFGTRQAFVNREAKKKNELFKIWNDDDEIVHPPLRDNRSSFFHSCVAINPQNKDNAYIKTQERLENVKREFSKMVSMTEDLLKKSQHSTIGKDLSEEPLNDDAGDANGNRLKMCHTINFSLNNDNCIATGANFINTKKLNEDKDNFSKTKNDNDEHFIKSVTNNDINKTSNKMKRSMLPGPIKNYENITLTSKIINDGIYKKPALDQVKLFDASNITKYSLLKEYNELAKSPSTEKIETCEETEECPNNKNITPNVATIYNQQENNEAVNNTNALCNRCKQAHENSSCSVSNICGRPEDTLQNVKDKDLFEEIDTNIQEAESIEPQEKRKDRNLQKRLEGILKKLADANVISEKPSTCISSENTGTSTSNKDIKRKQDIYDKLDSVSATDSENSFHMNERKSQIINITDLTNSLEDLERLDKICRIIEISDDLSDQLLSALNTNERKEVKNKKWSFKDLCEKIKLDEFCNKMFSRSNV
ncbi:uncharacterized protein [Epargyreus clarus]|uniref:uncharacterized protein n=1 Tax=Epargyreus clarus TaxID=520877 RepID=UPI003C2EF93D